MVQFFLGFKSFSKSYPSDNFHSIDNVFLEHHDLKYKTATWKEDILNYFVFGTGHYIFNDNFGCSYEGSEQCSIRSNKA